MLRYETIQDMKTEYHQNYPDSILLVLSGSFYNVYGKDAYILCYIFKYKIKNKLYITLDDKEEYVINTGFPRNSLDKVLLDLEDKKINYVIKVKNKHDIFKDFKKLNTYKRRYEASKKYCMEKMKINEITSKLDELCGKRDFSSILEKIEDYINEYENNVGHGC